MPGVEEGVKVKDTGVRWWPTPGGAPRRRSDALPIVWDEAGNGNVSSVSIAEQLKEGLSSATTNGPSAGKAMR